ncbi:MAG: hypothetical protein PF505_04455 [Vallitaleaceae bacterium]|jgi:hypothetical protein|nr:hypothetical protein [Vallitaleaceae bacterium]
MVVSVNFVYSDLINKKKLDKYISRLNRMQTVKGIYVVVVDQNSDMLMAVMSVSEFYRQLERGNRKTVIGLAASRDDAFECVGYICQNAMNIYQGIDKEILYKEYHII